MQFVENQFVENYYPTIESNFQKTVKYKGTEFECEIIDTAGQVSLIRFPAVISTLIQLTLISRMNTLSSARNTLLEFMDMSSSTLSTPEIPST